MIRFVCPGANLKSVKTMLPSSLATFGQITAWVLTRGLGKARWWKLYHIQAYKQPDIEMQIFHQFWWDSNLQRNIVVVALPRSFLNGVISQTLTLEIHAAQGQVEKPDHQLTSDAKGKQWRA